jgi:hypothetical protein
MNSRYLIASLVWLAAVTGINSNAPAEILYVGDANNTVGRYDAQTGASWVQSRTGGLTKAIVPAQDPADPNADLNVPWAPRLVHCRVG